MTHEELQAHFLHYLKSNALKKRISEIDYRFSDLDLLLIAHKYAPTWHEMMDGFCLIAKHAKPEIAALAKRCLNWQEKVFAAFMKGEDDVVFELCIQDTPDSWKEKYLCSSYEAALQIIPAFHAHYETEEPDTARYEIYKRRVLPALTPETFTEDYVGHCTLVPGSTLLRVTVDDSVVREPSECDGLCYECKNTVCLAQELYFPAFLPELALIRGEGLDGKTAYAITLNPSQTTLTCLYGYPLDSEKVKYRSFEKLWEAHDHYEMPTSEPISPDELPEDLRDNYKALMEYLINHKE